VKGVAGTWKDLTDNVNSMAGNLTAQVRNIAQVTTAVANGDLSKKITVDVKGEILELKDTINTMVDQLNSFASEVSRVAREVGTEGKLGGQARVKGVGGTWKDLTDNVNYMAGNLTAQVRNIADVTTAVARGELNKKITVDVQGEILELKNTVNTMVDQLNSFASEVTRVAREVGTEGTLGGQAQVTGVAGVWKDLTDNVNSMAANLTAQVRGIAKVVTAVANGDLKQQLRVEVKGEIATLADTINWMTETLATFADQVTNVAREVGIDGKLGGQARVPGAAGIWRDLTGNVNQLAANLTTQVRAIAEVATAVTKGDLTRSIAVEAQGEVAELKDNINEMIRNLRDTTRKNMEQDWLKTNLAKFSRMLQGQRDLSAVSQLILSDLAPLVSAHHGVFYVVETGAEEATLKLLASYAYKDRKHVSSEFRLGEGLVGQCAVERQMLLINQVPTDYIQISSGLGEAPPRNIVVLPVLFEGEVKAVLELATFDQFDEIRLTFLEQLAESIGIVLNTIAANMRTEELLKQSQALTEGLQSQQEALTETNKRLEQQTRSLQKSEDLLRNQQDELQKTNLELEEKAHLLAGQKAEVEQKNKEVEQAKVALEEKAEQLALISKYKSEFLANMSHELRTPLNSLLILSQILTENADGNLTSKQVGFAQTIHSSGSDLLDLINDILDLSKIESGTMAVDITTVPFAEVRRFVESTFRQVGDLKGLQFDVSLDPNLPPAIQTDTKRLQQVLKNLLSNAFKFTERGSVSLRASVATRGWNPEQEMLNAANTVIAFSVTDTGIGIPKEKHGVIFEAFQQGDGTTSRKYGGTGLGLSISRQITRLLGGEIRIESAPGEGSTFTLYLPLIYPAQPLETQSVDEDGSGGVGVMQDAPKSTLTASSRVVLAPVVERAVNDDRAVIEEGDRILLIAEDDPNFAQILLDLARERGFKGLVAQSADRALALAREYQPTAVTLDLRLPDADGWTILDRLKHDASTRHIPVHIISVEENWQRGLRLGAIDFMTKPATKESLSQALTTLHEFVDRPIKRLLVVEDDEAQQRSIAELIGDGDVVTTAVTTGEDALLALQRESFDCMVLDLGLPDMTGFQLITRVKGEIGLRKLPTIVYTGKQLSKREEAELRRMAESVVIKDAQSPERLLDETALFLHRVTARLPESKRKMLEQLHRTDPTLTGRTALVVDDDVRNIFALTTFLERSEMKVVYAESGKDGIARLQGMPEIDVVLMDVMMPEMDGYETMREIREMPRFRNLPIIAVTAKAMKGDREKCIEAGASDYIAKPVDMDQLLSLLRVWLYR
jgi:signal transduction histidine kinase/DNA-binding response OmpR family regulator/HAMP domain-containing protein